MPAAEQQNDNGHAVLTAKIYCTFVCFVDLFQSILMYGGQRLKLKDTREREYSCLSGGGTSHRSRNSPEHGLENIYGPEDRLWVR